MFPKRYFPARFFAPRYFPPVGVTIPPTQIDQGGVQFQRRQALPIIILEDEELITLFIALVSLL